MKVRKMFAFLSLALLLLLVATPGALAVSAIVSISPGGDGVFLLNGNAINYLDNMNLTVTYDPATMENLMVQQGGFVSGGTFSASSSGSGALQITVHLTEPLSGNGRIAVIAYTPKEGTVPRIISLSGTLVNSQADAIQTVYQVVNPTQPATALSKPQEQTPTDTEKTATTTTTATQPAPAATSPVTGLNVVKDEAAPVGTARSETPAVAAASETPQEPSTAATAPQEKTAAAEAAARIEPAGAEATNGVLERFKTYRGERSLQAFTALFKNTALSGISQEPEIVLSDGKAKVTLRIDGQSALKYSLQKAKRLSLKKAGENSWQLEVAPDKGTYLAALLVRNGNATITFPLTVAPPVDVKPDFALYLQERAKGSNRFDLNSDGVVNYVDDYIFTANYLAAQQKGEAPGEKGKK